MSEAQSDPACPYGICNASGICWGCLADDRPLHEPAEPAAPSVVARTPDAHVILVTPDGREIRIPGYYKPDGSLVFDRAPETGMIMYIEPRLRIEAGTMICWAPERHGEGSDG